MTPETTHTTVNALRVTLGELATMGESEDMKHLRAIILTRIAELESLSTSAPDAAPLKDHRYNPTR